MQGRVWLLCCFEPVSSTLSLLSKCFRIISSSNDDNSDIDCETSSTADQTLQLEVTPNASPPATANSTFYESTKYTQSNTSKCNTINFPSFKTISRPLSQYFFGVNSDMFTQMAPIPENPRLYAWLLQTWRAWQARQTAENCVLSTAKSARLRQLDRRWAYRLQRAMRPRSDTELHLVFCYLWER